MVDLRKWARTVAIGRPARDVIVELEHLLLADHPKVRDRVSAAASQAAATIAARQASGGGVGYTMWRPDRSATALSAYFGWGVLATLCALATLALPVGLAFEPLIPFQDVVMYAGISAILGVVFGWLSETYRVKAVMLNMPSAGLFLSFAILNALAVVFVVSYAGVLDPSSAGATLSVWPFVLGAVAACNIGLAWRGRTNQRAFEEDLAQHRAEQDAVQNTPDRPVARVVNAGLKKSQAALTALPPGESARLVSARSTALDILVSRGALDAEVAGALRDALPGTALLVFESHRVELGISG